MHIVKKLLRGLSSYIFKLLLLVTALISALVLTFHSPQKIENSLSKSGVYDTFVDSALQEIKNSNQSTISSDNIPISDPAIQAAAKQAFTPQLLQRSTENVLNGTYAWLTGKTTVPTFRVDLTSAKQMFAGAVGANAVQRFSKLPSCSTAQLEQLSPTQDVFSLPCQPPGYNVDAAEIKVTNDIATSKDFLGTPIITAQNLPKNSQGKTIFDQLAKAPKIYRWVNASPWLLGALTVLAGGITLALYDSKRRGLRNLALMIGGSGIFLLIISYVGNWVFGRINRPTGALGKALNGSFQQTAIKAANSISHSIVDVVVWFGSLYLVVGLVTLIILKLTKPKTPVASQPVAPPSPQPTPKTGPPVHRKLIQ